MSDFCGPENTAEIEQDKGQMNNLRIAMQNSKNCFQNDYTTLVNNLSHLNIEPNCHSPVVDNFINGFESKMALCNSVCFGRYDNVIYELNNLY